jgi:hypothetical protein
MDGQDGQDEDGDRVIGARSGSDGTRSHVSRVNVFAGTEVIVRGGHRHFRVNGAFGYSGFTQRVRRKRRKPEDGAHAEHQRTGERRERRPRQVIRARAEAKGWSATAQEIARLLAGLPRRATRARTRGSGCRSSDTHRTGIGPAGHDSR